MATTPLQIARAWEQLKSTIAGPLALDTRLLLLSEYWNVLRDHVRDKAYGSYLQEFVVALEQSLIAKPSVDLSLAEFELVSNAIAECQKQFPTTAMATLSQFVLHQYMKSLFYVGEVERGLFLAKRILNSEIELTIDSSALDGLGEIDALRQVVDLVELQDPTLHSFLRSVLAEWQLDREATSPDCVHCLFVEHSQPHGRVRGRMLNLRAHVEATHNGNKSDDVTFQMKVIALDDPLVGATYEALDAIRLALKRQGIRIAEGRRLHAHFEIVDSNETFTGDSIGLGAALTVYSGLLQSAALRCDRRIAGEVAVTGVIDKTGRLLPANPATIPAKVDRAFISHVKYLVVPEANFGEARGQLESLRRLHPRRQLILIGTASVVDVISDHNVVRSEKVCIGDFVYRRASRYARMTSIQVLLLLLLSYVLICLIEPRAWAFFDRNPANLQIESNQIIVTNEKGQELWSYEFGFPMNPALNHHLFGNLDDDGYAELVFTPRTDVASPLTGKLFAFDHNGDLLYEREGWISGVYPSDTAASGVNFNEPRTKPNLRQYRDETIIVSVINDIYPARSYIKFWTTKGDMIGWLIFSGTTSLFYSEDIDDDGKEDFIFAGFSNRMKGLAVFVVDPGGLSGVSPPYWNRDYDLRFVPRATGKHWIFFMPSGLLEYSAISDYQPGGVVSKQNSCRYNFAVSEGAPTDILQLDYQFSCDFRVNQVLLGDAYTKRFRLLVEAGRLPNMSRDQWADSIRNLVTYYREGELVTEGQLRRAEQENRQ